MAGEWTEERRQAARDRMIKRHERIHEVKRERIRRDAEIARRQNRPVEDIAADLADILVGNTKQNFEGILKGKE